MRATSRATSTRIVVMATAVVALVAPLVTLTALGSGTVTRSWTLSGVTFTDGGVMTGGFDLGSDGVMSNVNIVTSGGNTSTFASRTYGPQGYNQGDGTWIAGNDASLSWYIRLALPDVSAA